MNIDPLNIGAILIAVLTALGSWASHRSSAKASIINAKAAAEVEAYDRAKRFLVDTIDRQDEEFGELREKHSALKKRVGELEKENDELQAENAKFRRRIAALERKTEEHNEQ